ncbi:MAG: hypothetical protein A2Z18_01725 [Armatimonadetes bacterium RBG_16_58_9]|nr:MAG: hypothetical protein A2Z18_01725 [Armatimonadetes bacterium RBG_16_58_9]
MFYVVGKALSAAVCRIFGRWKVLGRDNIPTKGGALLCANHVSYIDPPAVGGGCPRPVRFMAKSQLFKVPVLGFLIHRVGAFPVKRGTADRGALRKAVELLESGEIVGMFPEGTRSLDGKLQEPELGAGMIALRADVPVIPVALVDTENLLRPHSFFFRFSRVKVIYGEPVPLSDLREKTGRQAFEEAGRRIMAAIGELLEKHGNN